MTDSIAGDGRNYEVRNPEKLASLKGLLLKKADDEREALLESARRESSAWLEEQNAALDRMVEQIHTEAVKRAEEISKRQISGAEMARTKERLRLQNSLLDEAVTMLQKELTALRIHPSYPGVLAGLAFEAAEKLPAGTEVRIQLASEDEALGETLAARLR
ncbi:MAG TPA: V-type ATP synthase subunit E family protein, partial [Aminivibrio sp.]